MTSTVDDYIKSFPKSVQSKLSSIRKTIRTAVPGADESISYKIAGYKFKGKVLVYFAGFEKHISLYPYSAGMMRAVKGLEKFKSGKGTIKFPIEKAVPLTLVKKVAQYRAKEIASKAR